MKKLYGKKSDDKYLPCTRLARKHLRRHIEEYKNAIGINYPNMYPR
jgi:hypothetical protein